MRASSKVDVESAFESIRSRYGQVLLGTFIIIYEGYDLGSERTLAAWIRHASRTREYSERGANRVA